MDPQLTMLASVTTSAADRDGCGPSCPVCCTQLPQPWITAPDRFHGRPELYRLVRCPSCSMVWLHNPPEPAEMAYHYGVDYDRAIASGGVDPSHWYRRRDEVLRHKSGGAILDLGCSSGGFLATLKGSSWKLFGIEMSEQTARQAEAKCGAQVFVGDILTAPFPPGSFDVITCFHVFEHLYRPREVLARVAAWLKPGGIFYAMMPNIDSAGAAIFRSYWYALELPRHLYHFSPVTLKRLASSTGLREVSITTHREVFIEASVRYIVDGAFAAIGVRRIPIAQAKTVSLAWKVLRKTLRLTILPVLSCLASVAGDGESIHAVFERSGCSSRDTNAESL